MTILTFLAAWATLSVPAAILVGHFIAAGMNSGDE